MLGGSPSSSIPTDARIGCDQLQAQLERAPGVALAEEREDAVAALVEKARRERERRVVGRLEPELEDDGGRLGAAPFGLVQPEAEVPGRARAAREAFVHPCAQPSLERRVPVVGRERRAGRGEPCEEVLHRSGAVARRRGDEHGAA